jgi:hypothetical protein
METDAQLHNGTPNGGEKTENTSCLRGPPFQILDRFVTLVLGAGARMVGCMSCLVMQRDP